MTTLSKGTGYFSLADSDNHIGSLFSTEDLCEILNIDATQKSAFIDYLGEMNMLIDGYVDEIGIYKKLKDIRRFQIQSITGRSSFDEYVLGAIFKRTFPSAEIEHQFKIGRKTIDFRITLNNVTKFVEFDGPMHFVPQMGNVLQDPFVRVKEIEDITGSELIRWPYWIQRCERNARILFDKSLKGRGALWSTNISFSQFAIPNPSATIKRLTQRFNAEDENGIGYFYEGKSGPIFQPPHKLIKQTLKNKNKLTAFFPSDANDHEYWLPKELR